MSTATSDQWNLACYSRCSLGNGKWFWASWESSDSLYEGHPPRSTGEADTAVEAERQATDSLANAYGPGEYFQQFTYYASGLLRRNAIKKRYASKSKATGTELPEFVYTHSQCDYDNLWGSTAYRIVKKTKTRVYVDCVSSTSIHHSWVEDGTKYHIVKTFVLDRKTLEEKGEVWGGRHGRLGNYHTKPYEQCRTQYDPGNHLPPSALATLGLNSDCSTDDIHRAYRTLAKQSHPDRGGHVEQFKQLQTAYEQALRIIK